MKPGDLFVWNPNKLEFKSIIRVEKILCGGSLPIICKTVEGNLTEYQNFGLNEEIINKMCIPYNIVYDI